VTWIGSGITIEDNPSLKSLHGLEGLDELNSNTVIRNNDALTDMTGLNNVVTADCLFVTDNNQIASLTGLQNLLLTGCLYIQSNIVLSNFCALEPLCTFDTNIISDIHSNLHNPTVSQIKNGICSP
jgi:hypothetical protein